MVSSNVSSMSVIQQMFAIIGENIKAEEKIKKLNSAVIETYNPKYSTISIFDGNNYEIKATNVETEYLDNIANAAGENDFKLNATKNVSKYLSTSIDKTLSYRSAAEREIRSAMFSPIYYKDIYLGFWLLEDTLENAFDNISKEELAKLKNNMGVFLESIQFQSTIENADNIDKQTGLYNNIYLYSNTRQIISSNSNCVIGLICLKNISDINEKYGRNIGNAILTKIVNAIKETVTSDAILIRYSGTKLIIMIPNSINENMQPLIERLFTRFKNEVEYVEDEKVFVEPQALIHTISKQNNIEKEIQKMVSYIEEMTESNTVKII
jgi:diguanylate cyclase (GGDEF)-like protein